MQRTTGKSVQAVHVQHIQTRRDLEERGGRTEEDLLDKVLSYLQSHDRDAFVHADVRNNKVQVITLVMAAMKKNFEENATIIFLDGTYKVFWKLACASCKH